MVRTTSMKIFCIETISGWGEVEIFLVVNLIEKMKMKICKIIFRIHRFLVILFSLWDENDEKFQISIKKNCSNSSIHRRHQRKIEWRENFPTPEKIFSTHIFMNLSRQQIILFNKLALAWKLRRNIISHQIYWLTVTQLNFILIFHSTDTQKYFLIFFPREFYFCCWFWLTEMCYVVRRFTFTNSQLCRSLRVFASSLERFVASLEV